MLFTKIITDRNISFDDEPTFYEYVKNHLSEKKIHEVNSPFDKHEDKRSISISLDNKVNLWLMQHDSKIVETKDVRIDFAEDRSAWITYETHSSVPVDFEAKEDDE